MKNTTSISKRVVVGVLFSAVLSVSIGIPGNVPQARAQMIVNDPPATALLTGIATAAGTSAAVDVEQGLITKALNALAWTVAKVAIQSMTKSIVNWINSGFEGSPAFETDLNSSLRKLGDGVAQGFLTQIINDEAVHSPFIDSLVTKVGAAYYLYSSKDAISAQLRYTLAETSPNPQAFQAGDFSQGGWNAWFSSFQNPANNPYGAQMIASQALANQVSVAANQRVAELAWGKGFLSWKGDCIKGNISKDASTLMNEVGATGKAAETAYVSSLSDAEGCLERETKTPGSVIESALIANVNSPLHQLELADSINEIVGALAQQLVSKVIGGEGLSGVSKPSQGGGRSSLSLATDPSQYSGSVTGVSDGFVSGLSTTKAKTETYKAAWQKIKAAALTAKNACGSSSVVTDTLAKADASLVRADESLTSLASIQARTSSLSSGPEQAAELSSIIQDYLKLPLLGPDELSEATRESADTGNSVPGSLYSQMVRLSNPLMCGQAGN